MRGRTARTAGAVLAAVVLAATSVLALPGVSSAAQTLTVQPAREGDRGVKGGSPLTVGGTVPAPPRVALLEALAADGRVLGSIAYGPGVFGPPTPKGDYISVVDGQVTGRVTLSGLFSGPRDGVDVRAARLVLCSSDEREPDGDLVCASEGAATRTTSNGARVDYTRPFLRGYRVVARDRTPGQALDPAPDRVIAVFSEPVRHPEGDSVRDWTVTDPDRAVREVHPGAPGDCEYLPGEDSSAGPDGCTRVLVLDRALGEDAEPQVSYTTPAGLPNRLRYEDFTSNAYTVAGGRATSRAVDRVRPAVPSITAVAGRPTTGGSAVGTSRTPTVTVGNLVAGQTVRVSALAADGARSVSTDEVPTVDGSLEVTLPQLPEQPDSATYTVSAVVTDPSTNTSAETTKNPGRADSRPNPVAYAVDLLDPQLVSAVPGATRDVVVGFSEPVTGTDDPSAWTITTPSGSRVAVLAVSGSGQTRTLSTLQPVPDGSDVTYRPSSGRYTDRAGRPVPDATAVVNGLDLPVVTDPAAPVLTHRTSYVVRGTAERGATVELYADAGDDGTPDGSPLASTTSDGGFALTAPLVRDAATDLVVLVRDPASGATRSVAVPRVTQDSTAPQVTPTAPRAEAVLAGGSAQQVDWTYEDRNPGSVRVELTLDGSRFTELSGGAAPGSAFRFTVPSVSTTRAQVRLTPRDAAGNVGPARLGPVFEIDAVPPAFTARTVDARTVRVVLPEAGLSGSSSAADWRVDGEPVSSATESTGPRGERVVVLALRPGRTLAPDATPLVRYAPAVESTAYRDRADQGVVDREELAEDGIAPLAPVVTSPSERLLTGSRTVVVRGTAEPRTRVDLVDSAGRFAASGVRVAEDGTWSVEAQLQPDATNVLRAVARDAGGNTSPATSLPVVEQDASPPAVTVTAPASGTRLEPGSRATATWRSTDRNPVERGALVELSTDGGSSWRTLATEQPVSGSLPFTVPDVRTGTAALRVTVPDQLARRGSATVSPLGIGQDPTTPSPTPTAPAPTVSAPALPPLGTFTGTEPARLLDTRDGTGAPGGSVGPGGVLRLQVAGAAGVPLTGASAVVLNLTAVQAGEKTHVSIVPTGEDPEATASITAGKGETVANLVTVRLGADGAVLLRNEAGRLHLTADVLGWYAAEDGPRGSAFSPLPPERLLDTREGLGAPAGQLRSGRTLELQVTGRGGVPTSGVRSVVLGLAAVGPTSSTHVTAWPAGTPRPETSNLNLARGATRANLVTVPVGAGGKVALEAFRADVHLVADVFGWYGEGATDVLLPVDPARVLDTRTGARQPAEAGRDLVLPLAGRGGLPDSGVTAVVLQLTAVAPSDSTHVTVRAGGTALPATANLNALRGTTVSSLVVVPVGPDGTVRLTVGKGRVHLVADVAGYFRRG